MNTTRTHVILPEALLEAIDARVGQRKRSRFIAEAIAEKLQRIEQAEALEDAAGALAGLEVEGWGSPESARDWVAGLRALDARREIADGSE